MVDREIKAENRYAKAVEKDGAICLKMNIHGRRGYPDRLTVFPGGSFFIEFKKVGVELESLQKYIHAKLKRLGYGVFTAHTYQQAIDIYSKQKHQAAQLPKKVS